MASRGLCEGWTICAVLYNWYNHLSREGKKYGYLVNGSKSCLIVKSDVLADGAKRVFGDEVNITTEGQRLFVAVIGSQEFKGQYSREKVLGWKGELKALSEIARSEPHATYTVLAKGYKYKFTYFHPRRPRGNQSGWKKRRDESFQARAEETLGTDSHQTISKRSSECWLLIGHKKCFVLLCPFAPSSICLILHILLSLIH